MEVTASIAVHPPWAVTNRYFHLATGFRNRFSAAGLARQPRLAIRKCRNLAAVANGALVSRQLHVFFIHVTWLRNNRHSGAAPVPIALLRPKRLVLEGDSHRGVRGLFRNHVVHHGQGGKADCTAFDTTAEGEVVFAGGGTSCVH